MTRCASAMLLMSREAGALVRGSHNHNSGRHAMFRNRISTLCMAGVMALVALRPLAVAMPEISAALPEVPTVQQTGLTNFEATAWVGVLAPQGTPRPIVDKLNQSIHNALRDPDLRQRVADLGGNITPSTPEEIAARISTEAAKWNRLARELNLSP